MTCKDCVHYDVCHNNFKNIDLNEEMTDEHCCVYFKDKDDFDCELVTLDKAKAEAKLKELNGNG